MYKEVALNPSCLGSFEYYSLLKQQFGFDKGRYVAADRRAWAQEAMVAVKQAGLSVIREQSIKNYLNKLTRSRDRDEFLLAPDRPKIENQSWSVWCNNQQQVRPFDITISEPAHKGCMDIDAINGGHPGWVMPTSHSVLRNAAAIVDAVLGLLRLSTEIILIDPYFCLPGNRTFSKLLGALQDTSIRSVCIVSTIDTADPQCVYQREYLAINGRGVSLDWVVVPDKYFHDRYLLTDVGALRAGHGFLSELEKGIHADLVNLNLIGIDEAQRALGALQGLLDGGRAKINRIA